MDLRAGVACGLDLCLSKEVHSLAKLTDVLLTNESNVGPSVSCTGAWATPTGELLRRDAP
jgi:hypothetical protein